MSNRPIVALFALTFATAALADTRSDLHSAFTRNLALKSFKATMVDLGSNRTVSTIEFQAPNRYRISPAGAPPSVVIGDMMYMNANGRTMKMPMPKGSLQFRNENALADLEKNVSVESLGAGMVGTQPAHKYRFKSSTDKQQSTSVVWIGVASGNVLQVETSGKNAGRPFSMRMTYSDFNSPAIRIDAPG